MLKFGSTTATTHFRICAGSLIRVIRCQPKRLHQIIKPDHRYVAELVVLHAFASHCQMILLFFPRAIQDELTSKLLLSPCQRIVSTILMTIDAFREFLCIQSLSLSLAHFLFRCLTRQVTVPIVNPLLDVRFSTGVCCLLSSQSDRLMGRKTPIVAPV